MSRWPTMNTERNLYPKLWTFSQTDNATSMVSQNKLFSCEGTLSGQEWNNILNLKWVFVNHKWNSLYIPSYLHSQTMWSSEFFQTPNFTRGSNLSNGISGLPFYIAAQNTFLSGHKRFVKTLNITGISKQ